MQDRTSAEYQQWRQNIRQRDGNTCRRCGFDTNLEVHHIKPLVKYPDFATELDNGLTLCGNCHSLLRGREETTDLLKFIEESPYSRDEQIVERLIAMMAEQLKALNDTSAELIRRKAEVPIGNDNFTEPGHIQAEMLRLEAEEKLREAERLRREADRTVKKRQREAEQKHRRETEKKRRREEEQKRQREAEAQQRRDAEGKLSATKQQTSIRDFQESNSENLSDNRANTQVKKKKNSGKPKNSHRKHLRQTNNAGTMQRSNAKGRWQYRRKVGRTKSKVAQRRRTDATVPKQDVAALERLKLRAEKGDAKAQLSLGIEYKNRRNDGEAVKWYRRAAQQGNAEAQSNLGWMYQNGRGIPQDDVEAIRWYQKAAQRGNAKAQTSLGWMYQNGRGIPQDDVEAIRWYQKAAQQGNSEAQTSLGWMSAKGRGVPQDDVEAVRWYQKAAQRGNAKAQTSLGWMYQNGRGIPQNDVEAIKWYSRAARQGDILAQHKLRLAKQH